jgi:ribosomal protein S18 acetylase RimI-like enzyme
VTGVRLARLADVPAIARQHCRAFPESLASQLGAAWIAGGYRRRLADPGSRLYVVEGVGFLASRLPATPARWLAAPDTSLLPLGEGTQKGPSAAIGARPVAAALAHLLRTGRLAGWLLDAAGLAWHEVAGGGAPPAPAGAASIDYVAVAPEARGRGMGRELVRAALADPAAADLAWIVGTTADNVAALALYAGHGFEPRERWTGYDGRAYVRLHRRPKRAPPGTVQPPVLGCPTAS